MNKFIKELSEEEFENIEPLLLSGGRSILSIENMEIVRVMGLAKMRTKFFIKKEHYPLKTPMGVHYILKQSKRANDYDFVVSIRTMKDKSGWVLLKLPKKLN